jgi:hypothetical protein
MEVLNGYELDDRNICYSIYKEKKAKCLLKCL